MSISTLLYLGMWSVRGGVLWENFTLKDLYFTNHFCQPQIFRLHGRNVIFTLFFNIIILHFPFSICIFFPSKRCWIECCRDFQIEQLQMAAVGYFACGNSNISTFHINSQMSGCLKFFFFWHFGGFFFLHILAIRGNIFRKPYHILRNLQKLSEFPPNDFFGLFASVKKHSG